MSPQNRIYITLSPRMRKALELCASLDGSTSASYAAVIMSSALNREIEMHPALRERWADMEREALQKGSWDALVSSSVFSNKAEGHPSEPTMKGWLLAGSHPSDYEHDVDKEQTFWLTPCVQAQQPAIQGWSLSPVSDQSNKEPPASSGPPPFPMMGQPP